MFVYLIGGFGYLIDLFDCATAKLNVTQLGEKPY